MVRPRVYLATSAAFPELDRDDAGLPDALYERGLEPRVAVWNDPSIDWNDADLVVVRSVRDYAQSSQEFIQWARAVPRILNSADTIEWNMDKHYLQALERHGLSTIPTTWLEPSMNLSKRQIHSRFPAHGDFVVKPAVSSGGRGTGRYTATDASSRAEAILHAQYELSQGRSVMVQRYLHEIDRSGEISLIYLNGIAAYQVEKEPMLHPRFRNVKEADVVEEIVHMRDATEESWRWGERIRAALHGYMKEVTGREELLLFNRVDIVLGDEGAEPDFYVMEISLIDGQLYLSKDEEHLNRFADAIQTRVSW